MKPYLSLHLRRFTDMSVGGIYGDSTKLTQTQS